MTWNSLLAFTAALFGSLLGFAALLRKPRSVAGWSFFTGMQTLAIESVLNGFSLNALSPERIIYCQTLASVAKSFFPGFWLLFSLSYSRGNYRKFLVRWRFAIAAAFILPIILSVGSVAGVLPPFLSEEGEQLLWPSFSAATKALSTVLLIFTVLILINLEKTVRAALGIKRWRIKFLILGLIIVFGARIYIECQRLLFSKYSPALADIQTGALFLGCIVVGVAYLRDAFAIEVCPSQAVLEGSFTLLLAGGYFFAVGILAQMAARLGGAEGFQIEAFVVLLATVALAALLISDRFRLQLRRYISRHFAKPRHDFRKTWMAMAQGMSNAANQGAVCTEAVRVISETFNVLSVTTCLIDERGERLTLGASTSYAPSKEYHWDADFALLDGISKWLRKLNGLFDLENVDTDWAATLREIGLPQFSNGGKRLCIPFLAGDRALGFAILADRVNGTPYTFEELDLLRCIGNQVAASLLNLRLAEELVVAKQLEAFQVMSAFFVHDLKNVVSSLSLTLQNFPEHFDDPDFREDALKGIAATASRVNHLIGRLSILRSKLEIKPVDFDLNRLVVEALENLNWLPEVELVRDLHPVPGIFADPERIREVVINLLLNARDAVGKGGQIKVATAQRDSHAVLSVADNGCGMSSTFIRESLFRPFHTTKTEGLGIGLFQSRIIVEAHQGSIKVESEPGKGSTFNVILPLSREQSGMTSRQTRNGDRSGKIEWQTVETLTSNAATHDVRKPNPHVEGWNATGSPDPNRY